jgi:signal transduction histidine kinase
MADVVALLPRAKFLGSAGAQWPVLLGIGVAYYLGAEAAFLIGTASDKIFAPFWPPNVILFCALVFMPPARWWMTIASVFPAHALAESSVGMDARHMLIAFAANCLIAVLNAASLRFLLGMPPWFESLRKTAVYIGMTAGINPAVTALAGALGRISAGGHWSDYWLFWSAWYLSNAIGAVTLSPFIFTSLGRGVDFTRITPRRALEAGFFIVTLVGACLASFALDDMLAGRPYVPFALCLPLPVVLWGVLRFGKRGGSGAILVVTAMAIWDALKQSSPFFAGSPELTVLVLQLFLIAVAVPTLLLSSAVEELRQAARIARSLVGSLLRAQDDERRRIARDIHDTTAQNLIAARLLVDAVITTGTPASAQARSAKQLINQSVGELQTVSYLLHPPLLDAGGLGAALPDYVRGFTDRSGIAVTLRMVSDFPRLPADLELVVYRVVQEALSNIARHSGSKTADVQVLHYKSGRQMKVHLGVTDFGIGITEGGGEHHRRRQSGGAGIGLASMRERVSQVGGRLSVQSTLGKTSVTALIPIGTD